MSKQPMESPLQPYRVLDLCEGYCLVCGKVLGDFGADVIKLEPPRGSPSRDIGPFYKDIPHPEKSLFWFAYNNNKRGITLNLETADGQELFKQLAKSAHFVIESFTPGYMDGLGLGYSALSKINPGLIMTSITPYGQSGPKSGYKSCELTAWASGGFMYIVGDPDRPPVWISFPQAGLNAGVEAVSASLIAHWYRTQTGEGQHVDVSMQACSPQLMDCISPMWDLDQKIYTRAGDRRLTQTGLGRKLYWEVKDGYVTHLIAGGGGAAWVNHSKGVVNWMAEEGVVPEWLQNFDWVHAYDVANLTQELVDKVEAPITEFFKTKTKEECFQAAIERGLNIAPLNTTKDLCEESQLEARDFWQEVEHPELGESLIYCGPFMKMSRTPIKIWRRPPLIGEHNLEIYHQELGISKERLVLLKQAGII